MVRRGERCVSWRQFVVQTLSRLLFFLFVQIVGSFLLSNTYNSANDISINVYIYIYIRADVKYISPKLSSPIDNRIFFSETNETFNSRKCKRVELFFILVLSRRVHGYSHRYRVHGDITYVCNSYFYSVTPLRNNNEPWRGIPTYEITYSMGNLISVIASVHARVIADAYSVS